MENTLNNWKRRKLTLLGKINIVKSLGLSKLIFIVSVLPLPEKSCDQLRKVTFNFIWDNKIAKIKRNTIIGERENRGLNMIDFSLMNKALKCIWIKRFRLNENSAWTVIPNKVTLYLGGFSFLSNCYCSSKDISIKKLPLFYIRTLQYWFEFKDMQENTKPGIKNRIIWNNKDIKIDNNTIFFRTWISRGVSTIENLLDRNLDVITYGEFKTRYQIKANFMTYYGVINAIPNEYKKSIKQTNVQQEQPTQHSQSLKALTTMATRKNFVNHIFEIPIATQRLIDNGVPSDHINDYFNVAFSSTKETKLITFHYKILHDIVFTKEKLFRANIANSDLCYLCLETKQDLKHASLVSILLRVLGSFPVLVQISRFNSARTINH